MVEANLIVGITIIILNLIPFIFRKPRLIILTAGISVLLAMLLLTGVL